MKHINVQDHSINQSIILRNKSACFSRYTFDPSFYRYYYFWLA